MAKPLTQISRRIGGGESHQNGPFNIASRTPERLERDAKTVKVEKDILRQLEAVEQRIGERTEIHDELKKLADEIGGLEATLRPLVSRQNVLTVKLSVTRDATANRARLQSRLADHRRQHGDLYEDLLPPDPPREPERPMTILSNAELARQARKA